MITASLLASAFLTKLIGFFLVLCFLSPVLELRGVLSHFFLVPGGGFCFWNQDFTMSGIPGHGQYLPKGAASALRLTGCCLGPRVLEIWVKASKIFGFFHQKVVPDFADEGRQILFLL